MKQERNALAAFMLDARQHYAQNPKQEPAQHRKPITQRERVAKIKQIIDIFEALGMIKLEPGKDGESR